MRVIESCAACLYDKQAHLTQNPEYLDAVRRIIDTRNEEDTQPYLIYQFQQEYERMFGKQKPYNAIKQRFNDLVLEMEARLRDEIDKADDPLATAMLYARIGNYIDFGAMNHVDEQVFLSLFTQATLSDRDKAVIESFKDQCEGAESFLLVADNCGEIVLDKLFLEQLQKAYPNLKLRVLVRGAEVLNDATETDAIYAGIDHYAEILSNGEAMAGTIYERLPNSVKQIIDNTDVILSKGQANYESLTGQGRHIFYSFLCKCDLFTDRFQVPPLTGNFVEELP